MKRIAFRMKIFKGSEQEYKKRHDLIWKNLEQLLREKGIREFSIFLDEETSYLFAYINAEEDNHLDELSANPIQQQWWLSMKDIMETNEDNSPKRTDLVEMFHMGSNN